MFAKLLKHELRNSSGLLTVLNLSGLGAAILGGVILRATVIYGERIHELALLSIIGTLFFIVLGMIGCYVASIVMLLVRYYKSKFTDQGYLTFTLPVNSHQIFLSSFLNVLIWMVISVIVLIGGIVLFVGIGVIGASLNLSELKESVLLYIESLDLSAGPIVMSVVERVVSIVYTIVLALSAITLGAVIAKKHKVLAAFGLYYGISYAGSLICSVIAFAFSMSSMASSDIDAVYAAETWTAALTCGWQILIIAAGYILSTRLMKRKLNLP